MEHISFSFEGGQFDVQGYPDARKVIEITSPVGKQLADLMGHRSDLQFALASLEAINETPVDLVREALWRSAIIHFTKCFKRSGGRAKLISTDILGDEVTNDLAHQSFKFVSALRDKHIVHDESPYQQVMVGALLNDGTKPYKIEKVVCVDMVAVALGQETFSNLHTLISQTLAWVESNFDEACAQAATELEAMDFHVLDSMPPPEARVPNPEDAEKVRI